MKPELIGKQIPVLDKGFVELQDMMGDDLAIVNAARTSFLGESKGGDKDKKLLFYLMEHHHDGPFEFVQFRFRIKAPIMIWWQFVRHRTMSYNLQSGRYVEYDENEFYIPETWRLQAKSNKQGSDGVLVDAVELTALLEEHYNKSYALYEQALAQGVAREQARLFLPAFAAYHTGCVSVDARNLLHFLKLRTAPDAQWEIRQVALAIQEIVKEGLPWTFEAYQKFHLGVSQP
ncbi:MAG: FAD-dependent thymidylate synthase [Anaerolineae bacterium]|jgi:thymidylate synthase (FAD)|nr:MAG: FAD-dependent thymidylate synthase [Anaerolineae bacterium]MCL4879576.1 FAD-dependent thymidylate synthase [Anaerolineae bacterium]